MERVDGAWKNFQLKGAAIAASTFAEVLYLDSDNLPLRDPVHLFFDSEYEKTGIVFWPDYNKDHRRSCSILIYRLFLIPCHPMFLLADNVIWRILGKSCYNSEWEVESGQILINKRGNDGLNLAALHIASHMQLEHNFWFRVSGGDKDTFRYAFWALNIPYTAAPRWLSSLGSSVGDHFCGYVMLQYDISKNENGHYLPLFLHANLLKHRSASRRTGIFRTIRRPRYDDASSPKLNAIKTWVSNMGGMCVNVDIDEDAVDPGLNQEVIEEQFVELSGGLFQDVEDRWFHAGGLVPAW